MNYKEALGLGLELSGYFILSYYSHIAISDWLSIDPNIGLTALLIGSLCLWTLRAFLAFEKRSSND